MGIPHNGLEPDTQRNPGSVRQESPSFEGEIEVDARRAAVRRRVILIAKHRFARAGYDGTSLAEIARAADVPLSELMEHFEDKLDLLMAVFDAGWTAINLRFADIVITSVSARDAVLSMLAVMTRIVERDEDLARLLLFESRRTHPETGEIKLSKGYREFMHICTELVVRGQKDGSFRNAYHPRVLVSVMVGAVENLLRDRLLADLETGPTPFSGAQLISAFDALVTGLRPETKREGPPGAMDSNPNFRYISGEKPER
jgi:AcrR family transcriptional regulator